MKKHIYRIAALAVGGMLTLAGCSNLDEHVYSEVTEESFQPTEQDAAALLASAYRPLTYIFDWQGLFDLEEEPGDCIITPTRPNGWDDGGTYRRMHQHGWDSEEWQPWNTYLTAYEGINNANRVKDQIESGALPVGDLKEPMIAELRAIRALWYYILLDNHGNVPLVTAFTDETPTQATRQQIYEFVVKELTEVLPNLSKENDGTTYGRMNYWAAQATLMRTYLNAEEYVGQAHYQEALACANDIINGGKFELAPDYKAMFSYDNEANVECIFAVPYDRLYSGFSQQHKWYPPAARQCPLFQPADYFWGGSCANPQFINAYEEGDHRLEATWLMGEQYDGSGNLLWTCKNYLPSLTCFNEAGENHTNIDWGYRVWKYTPDPNTANGAWSNDFPFFRYTEVLYTKAECLLRLGQNKQEAADIVSTVRARVFDDAAQATVTVEDLEGDTNIKYGLLDWDNNIVKGTEPAGKLALGGMYDEWAKEFACEAQRRTQMIRFGTYSTYNWFNHSVDLYNVKDGHTKLFPIPLEELQANGNLKQNPGY